MLSGHKLPGYRFPLTVIGYAVWVYHRFTLSFLARPAPMRTLGRYRDVEELLLERGIVVSRESIRAWRRGAPSRWCINFSDLFAQGLRHQEPRRGSRWHLDEMCVDIGGTKHWLFLARTDALEDAWPLAGRR